MSKDTKEIFQLGEIQRRFNQQLDQQWENMEKTPLRLRMYHKFAFWNRSKLKLIHHITENRKENIEHNLELLALNDRILNVNQSILESYGL